VRDLILEKKPKDWDVATDALPEEILKIFPDAIYENEFGTVRVKTNSLEETLKIIEVTTFRKEGEYKDFRHPEYIEFSKNIEDDLSRRDFTINAIALEIKNLDLLVNKKIKQKNLDLIIKNYNLIDPFDGQKDINKKIIKAVGNPNQRFKEDALRLLRAIRFAVEFDFMIESKTYNSIIENNFLIKNISAERIRDEFIKIIQSNNASRGILLLEQTGLLKFIIPELSNCVGVSQNKHHKYDVFEHSIKALQYAVSKNYSLEIRLAALFHDIGKPQTKKGDGENATFYNHEYVSAKLTKLILERLKFPKEVIKKVVHLVRYHMFYYNVGEVTESGVRRFIARVGQENIDDLIKVREADRIGSGVPKARVYKIRHLLYMIEKVRRDPISPKMLKINGNDLIKILKLNPGPRIGQILNILLEEVIDNPQKNSKEYLTNRAKELNKLNDNQLNQMVEKAKQKQQEFEKNIEKELRKKYYV
ncbi:MAG: HD domain-containing protein, partial [Patescibacteria group bacterium]|nr:HD domain-containing protein [Patescibacteria group bacterium]